MTHDDTVPITVLTGFLGAGKTTFTWLGVSRTPLYGCA